MNKELIQKKFAKNLDTYNENATVQKFMAAKLVEKLEAKNFNSVLEIGCGTGLLTELLDKNIKFQTYIANDIVPECEEYVKQINPEIEFLCGDIEKCISATAQTFDLIVSNAVFQWINDLPSLIETLISKLNPNGILLFSTFGKENCKEIYNVTGKTLRYYSKNELKEMIKNYNHSIEEDLKILEFKTPKDVLYHLKNTGVNSLDSTKWTKQDMQNFEKDYNFLCRNKPTLTYHPMYVKINI